MHKYSEIDPSPFSANQQILRLVRAPSCVLDVGCATGYIAAELKKRGCTVYGLEISREAASEAARHCDKMIVADLDAVDRIDCDVRFDWIIMADVLEHTRDPEANLRKALDCLELGGKIVCSLPNVASWRVRLPLLLGRFEYSPTGILDESHLRFFTKRSAIRMFMRLGLRVTAMSVVPGFLPYRLYKVPAAKWLDYTACRLLPGLGAQQFIFVLERAAPSAISDPSETQ